jgi:mRNA-degrading endonuclease RelE of RelBE toxin-antitoxin system
LSYKIAFKKSVRRDLKRISKDQADNILKQIEKELPEKADNCPSLTGKFAGLKKYIGSEIIGLSTLLLEIQFLF